MDLLHYLQISTYTSLDRSSSINDFKLINFIKFYYMDEVSDRSNIEFYFGPPSISNGPLPPLPKLTLLINACVHTGRHSIVSSIKDFLTPLLLRLRFCFHITIALYIKSSNSHSSLYIPVSESLGYWFFHSKSPPRLFIFLLPVSVGQIFQTQVLAKFNLLVDL